MAVYLNTNKNLENYKELYNEEYFVDKSKIISLYLAFQCSLFSLSSLI